VSQKTRKYSASSVSDTFCQFVLVSNNFFCVVYFFTQSSSRLKKSICILGRTSARPKDYLLKQPSARTQKSQLELCNSNVAVLIDDTSISLPSGADPSVISGRQLRSLVQFTMKSTFSRVMHLLATETRGTMDSSEETERAPPPSEQDYDGEGEDRPDSPVNFESHNDIDSLEVRRSEAGYQSSQTMSERGDTASQEAHDNNSSRRSSPCSEASTEEARDRVSSRPLSFGDGETAAHHHHMFSGVPAGQQYLYDGQRSERSDAATVCSRSVTDEIEASEVSSVHSQQDRLPAALAGATISSPSAEKALPRDVMDSISSAPRQPSNIFPTQHQQPHQTPHNSNMPVTTGWRSMGPPFNRSTLLKHTRETDSQFPGDAEEPGWGRRVYTALHQYHQEEKSHGSQQEQSIHSAANDDTNTPPSEMPHLSLGAAAATASSASSLLPPSSSAYDPRRAYTATRRPQEQIPRRDRSRSRSPDDDRKPAAN
jgi:hypothetical protein